MSGVLGVFSSDPDARSYERIDRMLMAMSQRGSQVVRSWTDGDVLTLAKSCDSWESQCRSGADHLIVDSDTQALVADITLYYRADLAERTGFPKGEKAALTDSRLFSLAYGKLGTKCTTVVEGDYAAILWDARLRQLHLFRDFTGQRPLYYATTHRGFICASTVAAVLAHGDVKREIDMDVVAESAASLARHSDRTCFRGIRELKAGHRLTYADGRVEVADFWSVPSVVIGEDRKSLMAGADELRSLLVEAVGERLADSEESSVFLSGGWDSSAIFASGMEWQRQHGSSRGIVPVSLSYPEGDPGRENDLISNIAQYWNANVRWLDVASLDVFREDPWAAARERDDASAHHGEVPNRELQAQARRAGARVAFVGAGGDQLFSNSLVYLADLVRRGRVIEAISQWRAREAGGPRDFLKAALLPAVPQAMRSILARWRGNHLLFTHLEAPPPWWFSGKFVAEHLLQFREVDTRPVYATGSLALEESHLILRSAALARALASVFATGLSIGVEMRLPLMDSRIVRFALGRPWYEKTDGRQTKVILRQAMRGLLPDSILAPRPVRTGGSSSFYVARMQTTGFALWEQAAKKSALVTSGMINPKRLEHAWQLLRNTGESSLATPLFNTLQAELWLRQQPEFGPSPLGRPQRV